MAFLETKNQATIQLANLVLGGKDDPVGTGRPLWRDYSKHQGIVDFNIAKSNGVLGYAARAGVSWGYQDAWFPRNWQEGGNAGLYRTSYHVLYPDQLVTPQADNWYAVHPVLDVIPRVIDLEVQNGASYTQIADRTWEMSELVLARDGIRPIIYSRTNLVDLWLATWTAEMLNAHFFWLAQYTWDRVNEHPGPPTPPKRVDVSRIIMHQTADKKAGFQGEAQSAAVDWDRWEIGDEDDMHAFIQVNFGGEPEPPPPPPPSIDCCEELVEIQSALVALGDAIESLGNALSAETSRIDNLDTRVSALESGGGTTPPPAPTGERYLVTDDKTLAKFSSGLNGSGYPIISNNIYEDGAGNRIKWLNGQEVYLVGGAIRVDGGGYFFKLQPGQNGVNIVPDSPDLYVDSVDVIRA